MNAQANTLERSLAKSGIPYRVIGGTRFFDHKEIRDVVAYLNVLQNPGDDLRLLRIINEPRRGIGASTLASAQEIAAGVGIGLFEVAESAEDYAAISKKAAPLKDFTAMIRALQDIAESKPLDCLFEELLVRTGYMKSLEAQGFEGIGRIENVLEFKSIIVKYMQESEAPTLEGFLEEIALYADIDNFDSSADSVTLMTIHSAKGLEFRYVYVAGMDEGVFPGRMATQSDAELEEERRLAYVAITRAKERLTLIGAERRLIFGQTVYSRPSRFISEIPAEFIELKSTARPKPEPREKRVIKPGTPSSRTIGVGGGQARGPASPTNERYAAGDRIRHGTFGAGTVRSAKPMAADTLLEIEFETAGTKKIMANFAKLVKE
jgi:DNA helicase-2/ATP-dependent DNA helicase PcrA